MTVFVFICATAVYLAIAWQDLRHRWISNRWSLALCVLAAVGWGVAGQTGPILWTGSAALAALAVGSVLFALGALGGGDVKTIVASILLIGIGDTPAFLVRMACFGGAVSLLVALQAVLTGRLRRDYPSRDSARPDSDSESVSGYGPEFAVDSPEFVVVSNETGVTVQADRVAGKGGDSPDKLKANEAAGNGAEKNGPALTVPYGVAIALAAIWTLYQRV